MQLAPRPVREKAGSARETLRGKGGKGIEMVTRRYGRGTHGKLCVGA